MRARTPIPFAGLPFSTRAARSSGVSASRLRGPDLARPFRGSNLPSASAATPRLRAQTLLTRLGDAFVCGVSAAQLWGAPLPRWAEEGALHVGVARGTAPTGRGIAGHRITVGPADVVTLDGIRLTSPARTWLDLAAVLSIDDLVAVGDHLIHHAAPLTDRASLEALTRAHPGRRGVRRLREAVELLDARAESSRESRLRVLLVRAGLRGIRANEWIVTSEGHRYRGDLVLLDHLVVVEYQSAWHDDPARHRADMTRRARLQADGWLVFEVHRDDLRDPGQLLTRLSAALSHRGSYRVAGATPSHRGLHRVASFDPSDG